MMIDVMLSVVVVSTLDGFISQDDELDGRVTGNKHKL
jgi:hypothetical protein